MQLELDYIKIGRRIKAARLEKGLNQTDLGAIIGCSNNHMSHVEVGQTKVSLSMLVKLSVILEKDFDYFLKDKKLQCSAEGHVSHIYADHMSSRPLGRSRTGVDKMSQLRIYRQNKGSMLELVRYQKQELPLAADAEEVIYSAPQMLSAESRNRAKLGELADVPVYSIPYPHIKKIAALKNHIWGL